MLKRFSNFLDKIFHSLFNFYNMTKELDLEFLGWKDKELKQKIQENLDLYMTRIRNGKTDMTTNKNFYIAHCSNTPHKTKQGDIINIMYDPHRINEKEIIEYLNKAQLKVKKVENAKEPEKIQVLNNDLYYPNKSKQPNKAEVKLLKWKNETTKEIYHEDIIYYDNELKAGNTKYKYPEGLLYIKDDWFENSTQILKVIYVPRYIQPEDIIKFYNQIGLKVELNR